MFLIFLFLYYFGETAYQFFAETEKQKRMKRVFRLRCFDAGGCYMGEHNKWPKDSIVWFRPLEYNLLFKATIIRQEKNFLICDLEEQWGLRHLTSLTNIPSHRVKVHKREIYDILTAPHFHYGVVGTRENFSCPNYPHYKGVLYMATPIQSPSIEE